MKSHSSLIVLLLLSSLTQTNRASAQSPGSLESPRPLPVSQEPLRSLAQDSSHEITGRLRKAYGPLPLSFAPNRGQTDAGVEFLSRGAGYTLFLTCSGDAVMALQKPASKRDALAHRGPDKGGSVASRAPDYQTVLRMKLVGANRAPGVEGVEELAGKTNYFIGNDPGRWRMNVPTYARVEYESVYPGIDLVYYGNEQQLEYDFVVAPGADPGSIAIRFDGAEKISLDARGNLVVATRGGDVQLQKPVVYQVADGVRSETMGSYAIRGAGQVGFRVASYDRSRPLIIDPVLSYSTYLGSGTQLVGFNLDESGNAIAVDSTGAAYVTGRTASSGFPTTPGAFDRTKGQDYADAFVTKLNPTGTALVYSTFLGGDQFDEGLGIAVDSTGAAYVTGRTCSAGFPTTPGAFQTSYAGVFGSDCNDAFVTKLDAAGAALSYSTYLGGSTLDIGNAIAVDSHGSAYIAGYTLSTNFPTTSGSFQPTAVAPFDAFVTKLDPAGSGPLVYSTYLGGNHFERASGIAVDADGSAFVTGHTSSISFPVTVDAFQTNNAGGDDAFVTKLDPAGSALAYSSYLGGSRVDSAAAIALDSEGAAYVAGDTFSDDFPVTIGGFRRDNAGEYDAFVVKFDPSLSAPLVYASYLGGSSFDVASAIAVDSLGSAYITGSTCSTNFPVTATALQNANASAGCDDVFVTKFTPVGSGLAFSTYLGGSFGDGGRGIAVDRSGSVYVVGSTSSGGPNAFPTTPGAYQTTRPGDHDAFLFKIGDLGTPYLTLSPATSTNVVETPHCVTATVQDEFGTAEPGLTVHFSVTFEDSELSRVGSATTDATGQATFCYPGSELPGSDAIVAFADMDGDRVRTEGEPQATAVKTWVLPATTPRCEIKMTNSSWIFATNGDRASFGGDVRSFADGSTQGQTEYFDEGPRQRMKVRSINVQAIVCDGSTAATIYGQATIDGAGSVAYRIKVKDLGKPGKAGDTYGILLAGLYISGEQPLQAGNVQIRRD